MHGMSTKPSWKAPACLPNASDGNPPKPAASTPTAARAAGSTGFITLFRVYPKGVDAKEQFARELNDKNYRAELLESNRFQQAVGEKMFQWYMDGHKINGKYVPHIAYSTGFRTASWNADGSDAEGTVYALKTFPMNVYNNPVVMDHVINCVLAARDAVEAEQA